MAQSDSASAADADEKMAAFVSEMAGVFGDDHRDHLQEWTARIVRGYRDRVDFDAIGVMFTGIKEAFPDAELTDKHGFAQNFAASSSEDFITYVQNPASRTAAVAKAYGIQASVMRVLVSDASVLASQTEGDATTKLVHFDVTPFSEDQLLVYFNTEDDVSSMQSSKSG